MEEALEAITDFADSIDTSNGIQNNFIFFTNVESILDKIDWLIADFHKIGGFVIIQPCLNSPHEGIRWRCAHLIACLTQNNPYCQSHAITFLPMLLKMLENDSCPEARIKALYAVSCNYSNSIPF